MPEPRFRSRTFKRVHKKLPGGSTVLTHEKRTPQPHKCAVCKKELKGIPRERPYKVKKLGVSKKRTERPYGGYLCSACSRKLLKEKARA
ncbi:50S ribosomal protein L34e [Candidatus Woesearchaeota archaeon]|nr:50S ribosomal protein L34e [Candidatus Woesearchaeota archaeon]